VYPASVTARPAGRASGATRSISRCTSVCRAARTTARTTSSPRPASARSTGPGSIARSRVAAWTADRMDPASRAAASQYTRTCTWPRSDKCTCTALGARAHTSVHIKNISYMYICIRTYICTSFFVRRALDDPRRGVARRNIAELDYGAERHGPTNGRVLPGSSEKTDARLGVPPRSFLLGSKESGPATWIRFPPASRERAIPSFPPGKRASRDFFSPPLPSPPLPLFFFRYFCHAEWIIG